MYLVLDKDIIEREIIPHIPIESKGSSPRVPLVEIINSILYKLKTGVQWEYLPVESLFSERPLHYKSVFYHYRKWCKTGVWKDCWIKLLCKYKSFLDLSSADLDGSHTPALKGGQEVGYQGRKKRKTTNALFLTDRQGLPLAMSEPISGNHHDLYDIEIHFEEITSTLEQADIPIDGLFLNADAGFDSQGFRVECDRKEIIANVDFNKRRGNKDHDLLLDDELYKERYSIERTNAWMDSFRSLLNRFDVTITSWKGFNFLAFIVLGLRKFTQKTQFR